MRSQTKPRKNIRRPNMPLTKQKKEVPQRFMTESEEDESDDTLLAKIDELLAQATPSTTLSAHVKSAEDTFFDEIVDMLNETDRVSFRENKPVIIEDDDTFDGDDYFDQILREIPPSERGERPPFDKKTSTERMAVIDSMEEDLDKIDNRIIEQNKRNAAMKKVELEIADPNYVDYCLMRRQGLDQQNELDQKRIVTNTEAAILLIKQLPLWSPARNRYNKILQNKYLSQYDKLQQINKVANDLVTKEAMNKKGFLLTRLTSKASKIHETIARMDINSDIEPTHIPRQLNKKGGK